MITGMDEGFMLTARRFAIARLLTACFGLLLLLGTTVLAQDTDDDALPSRSTAAATDDGEDPRLDRYLARERWANDPSFGLSFRPPVGATLRTYTRDRALVRFELAEHSALIDLYTKRTVDEIDVHRISTMSLADLGVAQPGASIMARATINPGSRPGRINYYLVERGRGKQPVILAHAFMQMDPMTFALLRMEAMYDKHKFDELRAIFESMFSTLRIQNPKELNEQRERLIEAGERWRSSITTEAIKQAIVPDQLYRFQRDGRDVGWMRVRISPDQVQLNQDGILVQSNLRFHLNTEEGGRKRAYIYDGQSRSFMSYRRTEEWWDLTSTRREVRHDRRQGETLSFNETGLLGREKIRGTPQDIVTLTRQSKGTHDALREPPTNASDLLTGNKPAVYKWAKPETGYLTQVEKELMGRLLRDSEARTMGFYCYVSTAGRITFRTVSVERHADEGYTVRTRVSPEDPMQVARYNAKGELIEQIMPDGMRMTPTTANELQAIWQDQYDPQFR